MTLQVVTENGTVQNVSEDESFTGVVDTAMDESDPNGAPFFETNSFWADNSAANEFRGLLKFDLSNIPSGATINDVDLYLRVDYASGSNPSQISFYPCRRNWVDGEAEWANASDSLAWTTGGAEDTTDDREATATLTVDVTNSTSAYQAFTSAALIDYVQDVVDGVRANDYGWVVVDTSSAGARLFESSSSIDGQRPELVIDYTAAGAGGDKKTTSSILLESTRIKSKLVA